MNRGFIGRQGVCSGEKLNSDSCDEIAQAVNEGMLPQSCIEMLRTKTSKNGNVTTGHERAERNHLNPLVA